jgi:hypothetical protein
VRQAAGGWPSVALNEYKGTADIAQISATRFHLPMMAQVATVLQIWRLGAVLWLT